MLAVNNLEVVYNDVILTLRGQSIELPKGKIVALLGANGAGKATTLRAISGLLDVHEGKITKGEVVLETFTVRERMHQLTMLLVDSEKLEFEGLFLERTWSSEAELRSSLVVTLMSVLELTKLGVIHVHQPQGSETIVIERKGTPEEAKRAVDGYDPGSDA